MAAINGRAVFLKAYPKGAPTPDLFELRAHEAPEPKDGQIRLRAIWMSVDPYMRGRMRPDVKSYVPPFSLDAPLDGGVVGEVIDSRHPDFAPGDIVVGYEGGWRDYATASGAGFRKVMVGLGPLSAWLGVLGMPGMTAWAGLTQILKPLPGETLFVSAAAGAVGSLVCQLGKKSGARVVASAGSAEKIRWLKDEAGADATINYREHENARALSKALAAAAPDGVDCYFENVGGAHLEAALDNINKGARIALCGLISLYNAVAPTPGPANFVNLLTRSALMKGFLVTDYVDLVPQFAAEVAPLLAAGEIRFRETVYEGLEAAPQAFIGLFQGDNFGKAVVRLGPDRLSG